MLNEVNVRGTDNSNFSGRNISISPSTDAPGVPVSTDPSFFRPATIAGGFFGSGGPRAFQFAARVEF